MRAVLDPNVLISALLSAGGAPARIVARWLAGELELIVSEKLLDELDRALSYPKLQTRIAPDERGEFLALLRRSAIAAVDPATPPKRSRDPGDDYLLALAEAERAVLVSGDVHLLELRNRLPVFDAGRFLEELDSAR